MYLSLLLILLAWTLWLGNSLAWLGVIIFILVINQFQITREEAIWKIKLAMKSSLQTKSKNVGYKKHLQQRKVFFIKFKSIFSVPA